MCNVLKNLNLDNYVQDKILKTLRRLDERGVQIDRWMRVENVRVEGCKGG